MRHFGAAWLAFGGALALMACDVPQGSIEVVAAERERFVAEAYPVLLGDCGFPACHGTPDRFFAVYGPGRTRLVSSTPPYDPATEDELELSYTRALSMLAGPDGPRRSPLLRKPLAVAAGGQAHGGEDPWGSNVYETKRDPRWEALFFWATAGGEDAP